MRTETVSDSSKSILLLRSRIRSELSSLSAPFSALLSQSLSSYPESAFYPSIVTFSSNKSSGSGLLSAFFFFSFNVCFIQLFSLISVLFYFGKWQWLDRQMMGRSVWRTRSLNFRGEHICWLGCDYPALN